MQHVSSIVFLVMLSLYSCAQEKKANSNINYDFVGVWQSDGFLESAAWPDAYQFYPDGRFVFNLSQYDGSKRILKIIGKYRVEGENLYLKVKFTEEAVGGRMTRSSTTTLSDSWELTDFTVERKEQKGSDEEVIKIGACDGESPKDCILLDGRSYFRMDKDPEKYN